MAKHDKGEKIELRDTRATKRRRLLAIEQKTWFWVVIMTLAFLGFGGGIFYLSSGLGYPFTFKTFLQSIQIRPVASGIISGLMAVFMCLTVRNSRQKDFQLMRIRGRFEKVENELSRFIAVLLRGMRIPLKHIREGNKQLAKHCVELREGLKEIEIPNDLLTKLQGRNGDDGEIIKTAKMIWKNAGDLDILPKGMLRIGRLRKSEPAKEWVDINSLVISIVKDLQELVDQTGASIEMKDMPTCIGDKELIRELFYELISNAIRYLSADRRGLIRIWGWTEKGKSIYCVQDNGVGIEEKDYEKVFEMFYRGYPGRKIDEGLGLSVVRKIVEHHNGRLWLKSSLGHGSTFTVALPAQ